MSQAHTAIKEKKSNSESVQFADTPETVSRRGAVQLSNIQSTADSKRAGISGPLIWFDSAKMKEQTPADSILMRVINSDYSGLIVYLDNIDALLPSIPERMQIVLKLRDMKEVGAFRESQYFQSFKQVDGKSRILALTEVETLQQLQQEGFVTCYECYVDDNSSLLSSIYDGLKCNYLWILFRDPTNIPLELVIASLQSTGTVLMKEIRGSNNVDDAIVSYGVMEYGAEGVIFSPTAHDAMDEFLARISSEKHDPISLQVGTVISSRPVGMGYRACIDTATLFDEDEGMIVGSTSQGGLLCCPEVFFLPYMELRPFRINAGAMHSYVFNVNNRTDYMSELKAGSPIMIVNSKGRVRTAPVGRMKVEQRPLRLIEVEFPHGERVNVLMQDDWHVRVFSDGAKPLNISELKSGDKVLGYVTETGRHVGIKINETIIEK